MWSTFNQNSESEELRAKADEIATLNRRIVLLNDENIRVIKGSDKCLFMISNLSHNNGRFPLTVLNKGDLPVYDVYIIIRSHVDHPMDTPDNIAKAMHYIQNPETFEIGTVPSGVKQTSVFLEHGYYQIDIRTRYRKLTQMLRFGPFEGGLGQSYIVSDMKGSVFEKMTSPPGFPGTY